MGRPGPQIHTCHCPIFKGSNRQDGLTAVMSQILIIELGEISTNLSDCRVREARGMGGVPFVLEGWMEAGP